MRIVRRTARRQATDDATALVAVASQALPAALPMEQMCAEQYQRIVPIAYAVAERTLGYDAARDVVQDVFFHFWRRWNELTPEHRSDAAIMSAVKNKVVDVMRRDELWAALL